MMNETIEYPNFRQIANDLSLLTYDEDFAAENRTGEIGCVQSDDGSVSRWSIVELDGGYGLLIETVAEGYDEDGNLVLASEPNPVYFIPITDEPLLGMEVRPSVYQSAAEAYQAFLDVVYTTEKTEAAFAVRQEAEKVIKGYVDPIRCGFSDFKRAFEDVVSWNKNQGFYMTRLANAMLCSRYPFLHTEKTVSENGIVSVEGEAFDSTMFQSFPDGWAHRFGLELCEDLRNQAWDEDPRVWEYRLCETRIDQIKEKYGELRVYASCFGKGEDIIDAYTAISRNVCISCGRADRTRITSNGWISPYCWNEVLGQGADLYKLRSQIIEKYLPDDADWDSKFMAGEYAILAKVLNISSSGATSKEISSMLTDWNWTIMKKEGDQVINKALGLLDGTPAPNGEPIWARKVIEDIAADVVLLEKWIDAGFVSDDGTGPGELSLEYGAPVLEWGWTGEFEE